MTVAKAVPRLTKGVIDWRIRASAIWTTDYCSSPCEGSLVTSSGGQDYSDMSMLHLFSMEAETQTALLNDGLLALERDPQNADSLETLMRAAHSLKGAARIVQLSAAERLAHATEDCFVAAQEGRVVLSSDHIEALRCRASIC